MRFDAERLREALPHVPSEAWSRPSTFEATHVHHGYSTALVATESLETAWAPLFSWAYLELGRPHHVTLTRLEPGGFIAPHRDAGPYRVRWQVPILTGSTTWGDGYEPEPGRAHLVEHWLEHSVWNPGTEPRVTLLVDVTDLADVDAAGFELGEIPAEYLHLVPEIGA